MGWESSDVVRYNFGPLLQGQMRIATLKSAYNSLIFGPRGLGCETGPVFTNMDQAERKISSRSDQGKWLS